MVKEVAFKDIQIGDTAELSKTITESDIHTFAGISMDFNPVHVNEEFAQKSRFKQRVAHGMLTASMLSAVIGTVLPGKNTIYLTQSLKFTHPVFIGDTVTAKVTVKEKKDKGILVLDTTVLNQEGSVVLEGEAKVMKD